jgi:hypothetical protein
MAIRGLARMRQYNLLPGNHWKGELRIFRIEWNEGARRVHAMWKFFEHARIQPKVDKAEVMMHP